MRPSRSWLLGGTALIALTVAAALLASSLTQADASTLSRSGAGWLAARRYLEERGTRVTLLDRSPEEAATRGLLVLAFPWQAGPGSGLEEALARHLDAGGDLLFAYCGGPPSAGERVLGSILWLETAQPRARPPLNPLRFRSWAAETWALSTDASLPGVRPVRVAALREVPVPPTGARILLRAQVGPKTVPVAFELRHGRARVMVVPADALSNGRLTEPGNADLLEALRQELGDAWTFDEFHHGLQAKAATPAGAPESVFTLMGLQLAFVYLMVVLTLVRRFGPAWTDPPAAAGSAAGYLVGLGALHHRLRHHREAGVLLVQRARELDGRLTLPEAAVVGGASLLALAQRVGRMQSRREPS